MSSQTQTNSSLQDVFGQRYTVNTPHFTHTFSYDPFSDSYFSDRDDQYFDNF